MAISTHSTKPIANGLHKYKEKENRRPEGTLNSDYMLTNAGSNGSIPKRYQSVVTEGTPLTSFGVRNDDNQLRSHSPPNHIQPQLHQRPLKPVKEFLTTHPTVDQQSDARWHSNSKTNAHTRSQTEITIKNVNAALTKSLNKLRQEPLHIATINGHRTPSYAEPTPSRPMTARVISHKNTGTATTSNLFYQLSGGMKGSLPAELITRRPTSSLATNKPFNGASNSRISSGTGPVIVQQPTAFIHNEVRSNHIPNVHVSTPDRTPTKSPDTNLHQSDGSNFNSVTMEENFDGSRRFKKESNQPTIIKSTGRPESPTSRTRSADNQHRSLPEVSVNPHIQSSVQKTNEHSPLSYEINRNGDKHTNYHNIQVEPVDTPKRVSSPVQSRRSTSQTTSTTHNVLSSSGDPLNDAYIDRDNTGAHVLTTENKQTTMNNDYSSMPKQNTNQQIKKQNSSTPPSSPTTQELNNIWQKQKDKYPITSARATSANRQNRRPHRPSCRLKNYGDESESETTLTRTQSRDDGMNHRRGGPPSDLGSDAWSDLTSEFSDTKLRKHPNIRTSTPNITRHSSSLSSKEVGQIRKQLTDLQVMYNDLLKLLDIDIESVRSSHKSSTSSQADHNSRRHRFRKVTPVTTVRQSNLDMMEINQRFTRLESSLVTLAESIAKLSAQVQMQRVIKDDINNLRQEVSELRQQLQQQGGRQQSSAHVGISGITLSTLPTSHQPTRLISPNVQRLTTANSTNPLNASTSFMPSSSMIQRSNSIIDPRQARKIEQFFGTEAMLRYFLSLLNYEEYAAILEHEKIGIYELPYISERKLQSLGIPYGPCARIIYEAQQYFISLLTLKSSGIDV
ncbi:unnamed protein product [Rotaria magnacalcarata]|uniref:SAM domain-containing protein n=2 Tax=Rotaria magnacalcarata TaxID=392030 RepID=A0A816ADI2_9BILA|nr:unnamed protein product [Rotaria magnacalcarata]